MSNQIILWSSSSKPVEFYGSRQARWTLQLNRYPLGIKLVREIEFADAPGKWYPSGKFFAAWFNWRWWNRFGYVSGLFRAFYLGPFIWVWTGEKQ
jgi:hypothetical protein